jgi:AraC-like DNA-binding protein
MPSRKSDAKDISSFEVFFVGIVTDPGFSMDSHRHPNNHELILVAKGRYEVTITGSTFQAKAGDILYYAPNESHSERGCSDELEVLGVAFGKPDAVPLSLWERSGRLPELVPVYHRKEDELRMSAAQLRKKITTQRLDDFPQVSRDRTGRIEVLMRTMREVWQDQPAGAQQILNVFLQVILLQYRKQQVAREHPAVTAARQYIHDNYHDKITLEDLIRNARMSKYHFVRVFRKAVGYAPMEYIRRIRVHAARMLLMGTDLPIKAIAEQVGLSDEYLLYRHFRKLMGYTPGSLRKPVRKD